MFWIPITLVKGVVAKASSERLCCGGRVSGCPAPTALHELWHRPLRTSMFATATAAAKFVGSYPDKRDSVRIFNVIISTARTCAYPWLTHYLGHHALSFESSLLHSGFLQWGNQSSRRHASREGVLNLIMDERTNDHVSSFPSKHIQNR
ncbi:hypothetical protein L227DRAFT_191811 [Lentinus tigrinus ALCF2SS1-6]|uniref:Uncharacterized protein n=1 Tax=Lentinus tigrinus ALCF2SS1-6 TaxID=1328759 RepID=A0A5C2S3P6_9APHY|nr:hypothetical protein L227DRAFT_191811 [Lentinus tigrinus ALCF2SS1-6]